MRTWNGWWIIILILLAIDIYIFTTVKFLAHNNSDKSRTVIFSLYWLVSLVRSCIYNFIAVTQNISKPMWHSEIMYLPLLWVYFLPN